jgi:hypothetical protein
VSSNKSLNNIKAVGNLKVERDLKSNQINL